MKWYLIVLILLIAFVAMASMQMLPDPIQKPVNEVAGKMFPTKKHMEEKRAGYLKDAENAGQ